MNISFTYSNGYSPIYFTTKFNQLIKRHKRECLFSFNQTEMKMVYLKTRLDSLERGPTVRIANLALRWCRDNLGVNNRKKYLPSWSITKGYDPDLVGEYDDEMNEILIYYGSIDNVKELLQTCIHEWTHQLQPITTKYFKYPGSYSRNPYERQARYNEEKYYKKCWDSIKPKVNKKRKVKK